MNLKIAGIDILKSFVACAILLASCDKKTNPGPSPSVDTPKVIVDHPDCTNQDASLCKLTKYTYYHSISGKYVEDEITYNSENRINRIGQIVYKYSPGKIIAYGYNGSYIEARLNAQGRTIGLYEGKYRSADSMVDGTLSKRRDSFDSRGNLIFRLNDDFADWYELPNGSFRKLMPLADYYEYDNQDNPTKMLTFFLNDDTYTVYGSLVLIEYLSFDRKINPMRNETLRIHELISTRTLRFGNNNLAKIRYNYQMDEAKDVYMNEPREVTLKNIVNENCFLNITEAEQRDGSYFPITMYEYACP